MPPPAPYSIPYLVSPTWRSDQPLARSSAKPNLWGVCLLPFQTSLSFGGEATLLGSKSACHDDHYRCSPPISSAPTPIPPSQHNHTGQSGGTFMIKISQHLFWTTSSVSPCLLWKPFSWGEGQGTGVNPLHNCSSQLSFLRAQC